MLSFTYSSLHHGGSLYIYYLGDSVSFLWLPSTPTSASLIYSTRSGFLSICITMLPRTFMTAKATPCSASVFYMHDLSLPQGPTYPLMGHSPSILKKTNNARGAHNAWGFILPHILHCHLLILDLVRSIICSTFLIMLYWMQRSIYSTSKHQT